MLDTVFAALAPLVRKFEGLRLRAYVCPAGVPTIGYGHTPAVLNTTITKDEAETLLTKDMNAAVLAGIHASPSLALSPIALAAIADFIFNLGAGRYRASTLRHRINAGEWDEVPYELRRWVRGGGRVLPGLVARRSAEAALIESTIGKQSGITGISQDGT
jgi:lysozyme